MASKLKKSIFLCKQLEYDDNFLDEKKFKTLPVGGLVACLWVTPHLERDEDLYRNLYFSYPDVSNLDF